MHMAVGLAHVALGDTLEHVFELLGGGGAGVGGAGGGVVDRIPRSIRVSADSVRPRSDGV